MAGKFYGTFELFVEEEFPSLEDITTIVTRGNRIGADADVDIKCQESLDLGINGYAFQIAAVCQQTLEQLSNPLGHPGGHMEDIMERFSMPEPPSLSIDVLRELHQYVRDLRDWDETLTRRMLDEQQPGLPKPRT